MAEYIRTQRLLQLREFCLTLRSRFIPSLSSLAWTVWNTNNHVDSNFAFTNDADVSMASYGAICRMAHHQCVFKVMTDFHHTSSVIYYTCASDWPLQGLLLHQQFQLSCCCCTCEWDKPRKVKWHHECLCVLGGLHVSLWILWRKLKKKNKKTFDLVFNPKDLNF